MIYCERSWQPYVSFEEQCYGKLLSISKVVEDPGAGEGFAVISLLEIKMKLAFSLPQFARHYRNQPENQHSRCKENSSFSLFFQLISIRLYNGTSEHSIGAPHSRSYSLKEENKTP